MLSNAAKADLLLVLVTLLASISWMFSKEAVLLMPPLLFMSVRFLLAAMLLAMIALPRFKTLNRDQLWQSIKVGLVFGTAMSFWVMGLYHAQHIGEGAFLTSLGVVVVPVISRFVFKEAQPASTWLALPVAVIGLALLALGEAVNTGFNVEKGQVFFVIAAVIFAIYFAMNTRAANDHSSVDKTGRVRQSQRVPALVLTAIVLMVVGCFTGAVSMVIEPWDAQSIALSWSLVGWVAASAVIGTSARFFIQTYAQSLSLHSHGVVIMILEPVWTATMAALWFGEAMSLNQFLGCATIFMALIINRWMVLSSVLKKWLT